MIKRNIFLYSSVLILVAAPFLSATAQLEATDSLVGDYIRNVKFSRDNLGNYVSFELHGPITEANQLDRFYLKIFYNQDESTGATPSDGQFLKQNCGLASYYAAAASLRNGTIGGIGGIYATDSWRQSNFTILDVLADGFPYHYKIYFPAPTDDPYGCLRENPDLKNAILTPNDFLTLSIEGWFLGNHYLQYKYTYPGQVHFTPPPTRDPVIIIPGIMGTYLYKNYDDYSEIWPDVNRMALSVSDSYLNELALLSYGQPNSSFPVSPREIILKEGPTGLKVDVFEAMIFDLFGLGYTSGTTLFTFPYDWRLDNNLNSQKLNESIELVLQQIGTRKVDIISHSMGGLLVKKYINDYGLDKIDQLIFAGTPQIGAPKAFKALMYGDDMGMKKFGVGLNEQTLKYISQNMPSAFQLLPSRKYVDEKGNKYVIDLASSYLLPPGEPQPTSTRELDYNGTTLFMILNSRNQLMFPFTDNLHGSIDNLDLSDIRTYNIVGCGTPTIGKIIATRKKNSHAIGESFSNDYRLGYIDGDSTVPLISSTDQPTNSTYYVNKVDHAELPSTNGARQLIASILEGKESDFSISNYSNLSTSTEICSPVTGKLVSSHSPVELHIYDSQGRHTGPLSTGDIEYGIPNVEYDIIEDAKFAFLPNDGEYKVVNKATDIGSYDFLIQNAQDAEVVSTLYYNEIPLSSTSTQSEISISPNQDDFSIKLDQDGDRLFESSVEPSAYLDSIQSQDLTYPETQILISGFQRRDYYINAKISFSAADDNSGILKTEYSPDNGVTWQLYTGQFQLNLDGEVKIKYFSTDKAGNIEPVKEKTVKNMYITLEPVGNEPVIIIRP